MKRIIIFVLALLLVFPLCSHGSSEEVLHLRIQNIDSVSVTKVRDALRYAHERQTFQGIILELDTYGGRVDAAEEIKNLLMRQSLPTIGFVNSKAESAGVLLALSCDKIVVNRFATIGSSETIPNTEKVLSVWTALLRDTAQQKGRDATLVEGMARRELAIDGVKEAGTLLNLTAQESLQLGFADYEADSVDDILRQEGWSQANLTESPTSTTIKIAEWICHPMVSTFLLMVAFAALVIELFVPGFGFFGILSILCFALYFIGHFLAGNTHWSSLAFFGLGLFLLGVEAMVPGFGLPGISGIILLVLGLVSATGDFVTGVMSLSLALLVAMTLGVIIVKKGYKSPLLQHVILQTSFTTQEGYIPTKDYHFLLRKSGLTLTSLRPAGRVEIEGQPYDVLTRGEFIDPGEEVRVCQVEGVKVFVCRKEM